MNTSRRPFGQLVVIVLMLVSLMGVLPVAASAQGTSDAAHLCQQGGWKKLRGSDGTTFANQGECVNHAAQGGQLVPLATVTIYRVNTEFGGHRVAFTATGFAPNSVLVEEIWTDPSGDTLDWATVVTHTTTAQGTFGGTYTTGQPCTSGTGSITITDSAGNTATGYYTLTCP